MLHSSNWWMVKGRDTMPEGLLNRKDSWSYLLLCKKKKILTIVFLQAENFFKNCHCYFNSWQCYYFEDRLPGLEKDMKVTEQENKQWVQTCYQQQVRWISPRIALRLKISSGTLTSAEIIVQAKATAFSTSRSRTGCCRQLMKTTLFPDL